MTTIKKVKKGDAIESGMFNQIIDALPGFSGPTGYSPRSHCAVFFTPSGGIPARSGTTVGEAICQRCIFTDTTIETATSETEPVKNLSTEAVGGSTYIQCLWIDSHWVANWEQCE